MIPGDSKGSTRLSEDERAAMQILESMGFGCEFEPAWVKGFVPDFFCGKNGFSSAIWVEVKSIDPGGPFVHSARLLGYIRELTRDWSETGRLRIHTTDAASYTDCKIGLAIARRMLREGINQKSAIARRFAVVPTNPDYSRRILIEVASEGGLELIQSCGAKDEQYGHPFGDYDLDLMSKVTVIEDGRAPRICAAYKLGLTDLQCRIAIEAIPSSHRFEFLGPLSLRARSSTLKKQIRRHADDANKKFRNARSHRDGPSLLMTISSGAASVSDEQYKSVFFGDLSVYFDPASNKDDMRYDEQGPGVLGGNGAWNRKKNRATSAAWLVRNGTPAIFLHNPWTEIPLPRGGWGGHEHEVLKDGRIVRV